MSMFNEAVLDGGGGSASDSRPPYSSPPSRYLVDTEYKGQGADRVRYDVYSDGSKEGPFEDPVGTGGNGGGGGGDGGTGGTGTGGTGTGGTGVTPIFVGTNPELLGQLQGILAQLRAFSGTKGEGFIGGGEEELAGFISGKFSFGDVAGALNARIAQARLAAGAGDDDTTANPAQINQNAFAKIKGYLAEFGLSDLEGMINELMARGVEDESAVLYELRNTTSFQKRFAANAARRAAGLPALSPRSYIDMENTYREVLRRGGMLDYFNRQDIFESLIAGDVSPAELYDRMTNAYQAVRDADAGTKAQMQQLYNVEERDLAAYFLNPKESVSMLKRRAEAAKIASIGKEQGQMQLTAQTAEDIAARGYTAAQASTAFTSLSNLSGLYQAQGTEDVLSPEQQLGAAFGYDPLAAQRIEQRKAMRKAEFQGGGQFASTRGATSGVVETGAGGPQ